MRVLDYDELTLITLQSCGVGPAILLPLVDKIERKRAQRRLQQYRRRPLSEVFGK